MQVGEVTVRLGADFTGEQAFRRFDRAVEAAEKKKNVETKLGATVSQREFDTYERRLREIEAKAKRRDAYKAALGGEFSPRAFNAMERELAKVERQTKRPLLARLGAHFDPRPWKQHDLAMQGAERRSGTLGKATTTLSGHLRSAGKAALAAGSAYAGWQAIKGSIDTTEQLALSTLKLHNSLNLSVESAGAFGAIAKARGIDSKQLAQSFGVLAKNATAAGEGGKKQASLFKAFGLSVADAKRGSKDFDFLLNRFADGFKRLGPGPERAAKSMQLLGRGWQTLLPILGSGSKGLDEQRKTVEKYGAVLGVKNVAELREFVKQQREAKYATMGLQVAIGTTLAPVLTKAIQWFNRLAIQIRSGKGPLAEFAKTVRDIVVPIAKVTAGVAKFIGTTPGLKHLAAGILAVGLAVKTLRFAGAITGVDKLLIGLRKLAKSRAGEEAADEIVGSGGLGGLRKRASGKLSSFRSWLTSFMGGSGKRAGARAADEASATMAGSEGLQSAKSTSRMGKAGRVLGKAFGVAMVAAAVLYFGEMIGSALGKWLDEHVQDLPWPFNKLASKAGVGPQNEWQRMNQEGARNARNPDRHPVGSRAAGGPIPGFGGGDTVPAWLERGEHIWTKDEVRAAGGHGVVHKLRRAVKRAAGGPAEVVPVAPPAASVKGMRDLPAHFKKVHVDSKKELEQLRDASKKTFKDTGDDAQKRSKKLNKDVSDELKDLSKSAKTESKRYTKVLDDAFDDTRDTGAKKAKALRRAVGGHLDDMAADGGKTLRRLAKTANARFDDVVSAGRDGGKRLVSSVRSSMGSTDSAVFSGMSYIASATNEALKAFDAKPIALSVARPKAHATGGIPNPGGGSRDDHLLFDPRGRPVAALSGTEGIVNSPQMGIIDQALGFAKAFGGSAWGSLGELWQSGMTHFAGGGRLLRFARGGQFGGVTPGVADFIEEMEKKGFRHGSTTGGNHAAHSYHYRGMAVDWGDASNDMQKLWSVVFPMRTKFAELFGPTRTHPAPHLMKRGQGFSDSGLQADHQDHIHTALDGGIGALGDGGMGWQAIKKLSVAGTKGPLRTLTQTALDKVVAAANKFGSSKADALAAFTGGGGGKAENIALGKKMAEAFGWTGAQWNALRQLWINESGWDERVPNHQGSGAYGIPQALPASKMASAGSDWRTNPATQIKWGLGYIKGRYRNPVNALRAWQSRSPHWYRGGGRLHRFAGGGPLARFGGISKDKNWQAAIGKATKIPGIGPTLARYTGKIDTGEKTYRLREREFSRLDDGLEFVTPATETSPASLNWPAIRQRGDHLRQLLFIRTDVQEDYKRMIEKIDETVKACRAAVEKLRSALKVTKKKTRRKFLEKKISSFTGRINALKEPRGEAKWSMLDAGQDAEDLRAEILGLTGNAFTVGADGSGADSASSDTSPDLQAQLDQATARATALTESLRIRDIEFAGFGGPGDIGTGTGANAMAAVYGDALPVGVGAVGYQGAGPVPPGGSSGAVPAGDPLAGYPAGVYVIEKAYSPAGQAAIAGASVAGMGAQGSVLTPRESLGG